MCTGAIYWVGIPVIVFGCSAEALGKLTNDDFVISCREILERGKSRIKVIGPILEEEGIEIHKRYW
jgi:tRNA(Arg) A34 adenosine deaminase TadA